MRDYYRKLVVLVCLVLVNYVVALTKQKKYQIAVLDFEARAGVSAGEAASLSDIFCANLVQTGKYIVVERTRIKAILMEQGFQQTEACSSVECLVEAGKILKVEKIFTGTVGKIGKLYTLSIQMVDVATAQIESNKSRQHSGAIEDLAITLIPEIASEITEELTGEEVEIESRVTGRKYKRIEFFVGVGGGSAGIIKYNLPEYFEFHIEPKGLLTLAGFYNISRYFALGLRITGYHDYRDQIQMTWPYWHSASLSINCFSFSLEGRIIITRGTFEPYVNIILASMRGKLVLTSESYGERSTNYSGGGGGLGLGVKALLSDSFGLSLEARAIGGGGNWEERNFAEGFYLIEDNFDASYSAIILSAFLQF